MIGFHYGMVVGPNPSLADLLEKFEDAARDIYDKLYANDRPTPEEIEIAKRIIASGCRVSVHVFDHPPKD